MNQVLHAQRDIHEQTVEHIETWNVKQKKTGEMLDTVN